MKTIEDKVTGIHVTRKLTDYWDLQLLALQLKPRGFTPSVDGRSFRIETSIGEYPIIFVIEYSDQTNPTASKYKAKLITQSEIPSDTQDSALREFENLVSEIFEVH